VHSTVGGAGNFLGIMLYDALFRLATLVGPAHRILLGPFPALLFRWDCLVRCIPGPACVCLDGGATLSSKVWLQLSGSIETRPGCAGGRFQVWQRERLRRRRQQSSMMQTVMCEMVRLPDQAVRVCAFNINFAS